MLPTIANTVHVVCLALDRAIRDDTERLNSMDHVVWNYFVDTDRFATCAGTAIRAASPRSRLLGPRRSRIDGWETVQGGNGRPWRSTTHENDISIWMQEALSLIEFFGGDTSRFRDEPSIDPSELHEQYDLHKSVVAYVLALGRMQERATRSRQA